MSDQLKRLSSFCKELYPGEDPVPLHAPRFLGNERNYLVECIDSTYVSYVGKFVALFEERIKETTGARNAVAVVNGTAALQLALLACGVQRGDLVITQALTFVATPNAIRHAGADPVFIDVERDSMGMSPGHLMEFLSQRASSDGKACIDKQTGRRIGAIVPMHTFGHPVRIREITQISSGFGIPVVEDAAESLGSSADGIHTGRFGKASILSFNGNKIITTGGGGMVVTDDDEIAEYVRDISSTAKQKHRWEFFHTQEAFNLRLPNVNAAIGVAQMESFPAFLADKRETACHYRAFCDSIGLSLFPERGGTRANNWLNCLILKDRQQRDEFLQLSNDGGVQTRPIWVLMNKLPMYESCIHEDLSVSEWFEDRVVNIPSSFRPNPKQFVVT